MKKIQIFISIFTSKIVQILSKLLGNRSSAIPGKIARTICPDILSHLSKQITRDTIIITGTNGKTTTNNILRDILKTSGHKVVCNDVGANMINGVTSAYIKSANFFGNLNSSYACIEVDEASLPKVLDEVIPSKIVITNLFRDQLDRFGEIDLTIKTISSALDKIKDNDTTLILNADDPLVAQFTKKHDFKTLFYGIDSKKKNSCEEDCREGRFCTLCGSELVYDYYYYSQLGEYHCTNCEFKRPKLDFVATNVDLSSEISFDIVFDKSKYSYIFNSSGFYNVYNCLAAISASLSILISPETIQGALSIYKPQIGRMEKFTLPKPVVLNLSKNPAGFNQTIDAILEDTRPKNIMIVINDNAQDGKDISWLWDCDFEKLTHANSSKFMVSGIRKEDMAVRLKYADIPQDKIILEEDIKKAIFKLFDEEVEVIYIIVNYTALFYTQNILKSLEKAYGLDVVK